MKVPPCLMRLRLTDPNHRFNLWIPLVLVWIIAGLLALALSPLILLLVLLLWPTGWGKFLWYLGPRFYDLICALKGLEVDVRSKDQVQIYFK
jgi:hypothetical protein